MRNHRIGSVIFVVAVCVTAWRSPFGQPLSQTAGTVSSASRPMAPWPPPPGPLRVIIDTDAANEIDDQHALALALGFPERLHIEGIVAAHFDEPQSIEKSLADIQEVLKRAGLAGKIPVKQGVTRLRPSPNGWPTRSAGSDDGIGFIIEKARLATPEEPLWLVLLGTATDAMAVLRHEPGLADRLVVFWHSRSQWPENCWNYNARGDPLAARAVLRRPWRVVLFDTGHPQLRLEFEEFERRFAPIGPLGAFLHEIRDRRPGFRETWALTDLGDIAALVNPDLVKWERTRAPDVDEEMRYVFPGDLGEIFRLYDIDGKAAFDLLEESLKRLHGKAQQGD